MMTAKSRYSNNSAVICSENLPVTNKY